MLTYWDLDCLLWTGANHNEAAKRNRRGHICAGSCFITSASSLSKHYLVIKF